MLKSSLNARAPTLPTGSVMKHESPLYKRFMNEYKDKVKFADVQYFANAECHRTRMRN